MNENIFEAQYDVTKKTKIKKFYESYKILIYTILLLLIIFSFYFIYYLNSKENKIIQISENYIEARVQIEKGQENEATNILRSIIFANNKTYSTLSFFLILNQNLITERQEISILFNHLLNNNQYENELKNLIIYKKALFDSNFLNEKEILEELKPILNSDSVWKAHALLLLGNYFLSKGENLKAKEFYTQILNIQNLQDYFYNQAIRQLSSISND
jgi:predicted negative regulator of RcsB-dependent stress response